MDGWVDGEDRNFLIALGKSAQKKHAFRTSDRVSGLAEPVADPQLEVAEFYKATKLKLLSRPDSSSDSPPPWLGPPPDLSVYRER